jgi:hypothetical protein
MIRKVVCPAANEESSKEEDDDHHHQQMRVRHGEKTPHLHVVQRTSRR